MKLNNTLSAGSSYSGERNNTAEDKGYALAAVAYDAVRTGARSSVNSGACDAVRTGARDTLKTPYGGTSAAAGKRSAGILVRLIVCMMLTLAMVMPMAVPAEVFAANETAAAAQTKASKYTTSQTQSLAGLDIVFSGEVISNKYLKNGPTLLNTKGKSKSVKLSWKGVVNPASIKGYIILRRDREGNTWRQIATVDANKTTYTDKTANEKNLLYRYSVMAYKMKSGKVMVSGPAGWAGAMTSKSKKKNVYDITVSNPASTSIVMIGSCAQASLKFPKKAASKYIRWWSGNDAVATVDNKGLITGVAAGETVIYVKTHSGRISTFPVKVEKGGTAQAMIDTFYAWEGYSRINGKQKGIIDIYNSITPWPVNYKMKYTDAWCDATVTAAAIKTGNVERIGRECSVPRHIKIFKKLGIWEEDGTITPKPGDIIVYSWRKFKQPNNASASHIGIVAKVEGKTITAIEGNRGIGIVATRTMPVGWGCIRGYARPKYEK